MHPFPHEYKANIAYQADDADVRVRSPGLPELITNAPVEFDGPGNRWSPETMLIGAVADCFVLSFKAIARASQVEWHNVGCEVTGTLDRIDRKTRFTALKISAKVSVPAASEGRVKRILEKAEESCLITNSLSATIEFKSEVNVVE
jgi:peroxiredoxin-like protein